MHVVVYLVRASFVFVYSTDDVMPARALLVLRKAHGLN